MAALLMAVLVLLSLIPAVYAAEYDPNHPEILSEGHLNATAAILIEASTGKVIFEKNILWLSIRYKDQNSQENIPLSEDNQWKIYFRCCLYLLLKGIHLQVQVLLRTIS